MTFVILAVVDPIPVVSIGEVMVTVFIDSVVGAKVVVVLAVDTGVFLVVAVVIGVEESEVFFRSLVVVSISQIVVYPVVVD